jgi:hypothetical protein
MAEALESSRPNARSSSSRGPARTRCRSW